MKFCMNFAHKRMGKQRGNVIYFAHHVCQWIVFNHPIVQNKTVGCSICRHILFTLEFYAHGTVLFLIDSFCHEQSITTRGPNSKNSATVNNASLQYFHNTIYGIAYTCETRWHAYSCQSPCSDHHMGKIPT